MNIFKDLLQTCREKALLLSFRNGQWTPVDFSPSIQNLLPQGAAFLAFLKILIEVVESGAQEESKRLSLGRQSVNCRLKIRRDQNDALIFLFPELAAGKFFTTIPEQEESYRRLIEFFPDPLVIMNLEGEILGLNKEALNLLFYPSEMLLLGKQLFSLIQDKDRSLVTRIYRDVYQTSQPIQQSLTQEFRLLRRDNKEIYVSARTSLILDSNSVPNGILMLLHDISAQKLKRKEQILRHDMAIALGRVRSLEGLMNIGLNTLIPLSRMDFGGVFMLEEDVFRYLNIERDERLLLKNSVLTREKFSFWEDLKEGRSFYLERDDELLAELDIFEMPSLLSAVLLPVRCSSRIWGFFCMISHSSGWISDELRHTLETISAQVGGVVSRLEAEEKLRQSESLYRSLISTMPSSLVLHSKEGTILKYNQAAQSLFHFDKMSEDMRKMHITWGWTDETGILLKREEYPFIKALSTGEPIRNSLIGLPRSGDSPLWLSVNCQPLYSGNQLDAVVAVYRDITEYTRALRALKRAKIEAEQASQSKSIFLSNMSHEIRTPLSGIIGLTDVLLDKVEDVGLRSDLVLIRQTEETLLDIVNNVLDIYRIESGKMNLIYKPFHLEGFVDKMLLPISQRCHEKGLLLKTSLDPTIPTLLWGDAPRLGRVLLNLLGNAVKFTQKGTVTLDIELKQRISEEKICLEFSVKDTGIGIDPENYEVIFENFHQIEHSFSKNYQGTGLGLSISRNLVHMMDGEIQVKSAPGEGSDFRFTSVFSLSGKKESGNLQDSPGKRSYSILLAEDNPLNKRALTFFLQKEGHLVETVSNGNYVLEKRKEGKSYDLILMDIQMPRMGGVEAAQIIRSEDSVWKDIPIIALTAYALTEDRERFLNAGMNGYVSKPVDTALLLREIERVMDHVEDPSPAGKNPAKAGGLNLFYEFYQDDPNAIQEVAALFLNTRGHLNKVEAYCLNDDCASAAPLFHDLTNNLSAVCQRKLGLESRRLEEHCLKGNLVDARALFPGFKQSMETLYFLFEKQFTN